MTVHMSRTSVSCMGRGVLGLEVFFSILRGLTTKCCVCRVFMLAIYIYIFFMSVLKCESVNLFCIISCVIVIRVGP